MNSNKKQRTEDELKDIRQEMFKQRDSNRQRFASVMMKQSHVITHIRKKTYSYFMRNVFFDPAKIEELKNCLAQQIEGIDPVLIFQQWMNEYQSKCIANNEVAIDEDDDMKVAEFINKKEQICLIEIIVYLINRHKDEDHLMHCLAINQQMVVINGNLSTILAKPNWNFFELDFDFLLSESAKDLPSSIWLPIAEKMYNIFRFTLPIFFPQNALTVCSVNLRGNNMDRKRASISHIRSKIRLFREKNSVRSAANLYYAIQVHILLFYYLIKFFFADFSNGF